MLMSTSTVLFNRQRNGGKSSDRQRSRKEPCGELNSFSELKSIVYESLWFTAKIILKKWPSFAFIKQLECKKVSNEAVAPQIHYWLSRKDHISNGRGKKAKKVVFRNRSSEQCIAWYLRKYQKHFFSWIWPKKSIFKWKPIQGIYTSSYAVWYFPDNVNGQMLMEVSELEPRKGKHDTKCVKLSCPWYIHSLTILPIVNPGKENVSKWEGRSWNRKIYSFSSGDFTTSASSCGGSTLASS